ncbi:Bax inhibitor-1/YccA family protein [Telmatospirillum sp.]|uniref:Bax inhibitor-1/YccA family protein n=1 Tax=Telmatospirillum sp. TaxID=2079197 RepID=UPI00284D7FCF|nr:Bax inhibitor-1/YccA family protein [Telmatospirillum sp.]MDR3440458.1 Bax inhibitor-1/YccA family protein [Telmatospirillum sp.]
MAFDTQRGTWTRAEAEAAQIDVGLRQYMLRVYNYMASGLALTGLVAALVAGTPAVNALFFQVGMRGAMQPTGLGWLAIIAPIGLVFAISLGVARMRASTAQGLFWLYAALMGVSLSTLFMVYTGASITRVFFITAASFAGLSLYGYTTRRNLSAFGTFLVMGLWGLVIASLVNMFIASSALNFVISVAGVGIFAGLTAWDTQKIKEMYWAGDDGETAGKKALMGALTLYLDFINLFIMLVRLMGDRRN